MAADPNSPAAQAALKAAGWTPEQYRQYAATRPDLAGSGGGFAGVSDADLMALLGGSGGEANGSLSDLPLGYSYDRATNQVYRQTANGPVAVGREELMAATLAEKQMAGGGSGGGAGAAPPHPESMIDPRTGELVMIDANGGVTRTGNVLGFGGIDPRDQFAADENQRGFQNALASRQNDLTARGQDIQQRQQAIDQFESAQNRLIQVAGQKEQGRQADLRAAVDQWQTAMNLIPQMGQLSLQESERVQGILSGGGDFLARAFESRGGTSPLAKVTQADQINAIGSSLTNLRNMVAQNTGGGPAAGGGYQAPQLDQSGGGFAPVAPLGPAPTYKPYEMPAAPIVAPPPAPAPAVGGGGGGGFSSAPAPAPAYNPERDSWEGNDLASRAGATGLNSRDNPNMFPGITGGGTTAPAPAAPIDWGNPEADTGAPRAVSNFNYRPGADYVNKLKGFLGFKDGTPSEGYTTEPAFLINEKGPELVENLDGGRIRVHDAEATRKMVPGYDSGTLTPEKAAIMLHEGMANGHPLTEAQRGFFGARMHGYDEGTAGGYRIDNFAHRLSDASNLDYASLPGAMVGGGIAGGGFRDLLSLLRRPTPAAGPLVRDVGLGAYSARRVGTGFVDAAQKAYGSVPRYATGTIDATAAINAYNNGDTGALGGFNAQYGSAGVGTGFGTSSMVAPGPSSGFGMVRDTPSDMALNNARRAAGMYDPAYMGAQQQARDEANRAAVFGPKASLGPGRDGSTMPAVTQTQLAALARSTAPPAVTAALAGKMPPAREQLKAADNSGTLPIFTARQLGAMTQEERDALGTATNAIFNAPGSYLMDQTQRNYGPSQQMQRGFLRGAGL